jgi:hypothetical protein
MENKPKREIDKKYRKFISKQKCCICNARGNSFAPSPPSDPHHWNAIGSGGMATKTSDRNCLPFCSYHHYEFHCIGRISFLRKYKMEEDDMSHAITWYNNPYERNKE